MRHKAYTVAMARTHTHTHTHTQRLGAQPLRVVTDSRYVYDGATRYLNRWFLLGHHVTNCDLWEALRNSLSARSAPTRNPL